VTQGVKQSIHRFHGEEYAADQPDTLFYRGPTPIADSYYLLIEGGTIGSLRMGSAVGSGERQSPVLVNGKHEVVSRQPTGFIGQSASPLATLLLRLPRI
jgi:hypothetical protein